MSTARLATLIHNAKNRLASVIARLENECLQASSGDIRELRVVAGQLSSVMALVRAEDPSLGVRMLEVDLDMFFGDLRDEANLLAPPGVKVNASADFSASLFPVWTFDSVLVRCVLLDALNNAWRHARQRVGLSAYCEDGWLVFEIQDDGPGFPEEWLCLNEGQGGCLPVSVPEGTGEGLLLAQKIARLHQLNGQQGSVQLRNQEGTRFILRLP